MALSPKEMQDAIIANLSLKTGRDLAAWVALARAKKAGTRAETVRWLKSEHGLGHVTAQVVAEHAEGRGDAYAAEDALLDGLVPPPLRESYAQVEKLLRAAAPKVERVVCKTYVGFRAGRQFAAVRAEGDALLVALRLGDEDHGLARTRFRAGGGLTHALHVRGGDDLRALTRAARTAAKLAAAASD